MAVEDFFKTYQQALAEKKIVNPLSPKTAATVAKPSRFGISSKAPRIIPSTGFGEKVPSWLTSKSSSALDRYMQSKTERTDDLASKYIDMAAGQVKTDEYGIVQDKTTDFSKSFEKQLGSINEYGKAALGTAEAKARWQSLQGQAEMNAGYQVNWTPGAGGNNPGAKAVSLAMTAYQNKVPYVWGGNSLSRGIDCSGLVQQVYKQLGINLPRTTYQQAKHGKTVNMNSLLPGDLLFYNTGSGDPNGIGSLSHVAIYIGNGKIVDARNSRSDMKVGTMNVMGGPVRAVRPW